MNANIKPGDRLRITILCEANLLDDRDMWVTVPAPYTPRLTFKIPLDSKNVTIEVLTPRYWPPKRGDVWTDGEDREWFAVQDEPGDPVMLVAEHGNHAVNDPEELLPLHSPWRIAYKGRERREAEHGEAEAHLLDGEPPF